MPVVREVDVHDESQLHQWWQTCQDAMAGRVYDALPPWEFSRRALATPHTDFDQLLLAAYDGAEMVGGAALQLPLADNLLMAYGQVCVPPEHRRRGVGKALVAALEERARGRDRKYHLAEVLAPPGVTGSDDERFALARGYAVANREGLKMLWLGDHPDWAPLDERVAQRIGDYRIEHWGNFTPPDLAQAVCDALNVFVDMIPTGDIPLENTTFTPERLRRNEERGDGIGRRRFCTAALAPDGSLVGYTDAFVNAHHDRQANVGITMVLPEHRGHALGLAMKLAHHRSLQAAIPACEIVRTSNADVNQHMNAVNEAMGYRVVEDLLEMQKEL
jgi:GNAT superfamily N-acetyltransferase